MRDWILDLLQRELRELYDVHRQIASGGMGTVYLAGDRKHERQVAIKVLHPALADTLDRERFLREIRILGRLIHPHILPLYDSGEIMSDGGRYPGLLYFVMPYVEGETLRARIEEAPGGRLPVGEAVHYALHLADALGYAHQRNIMHRDVKPGNVLLTPAHAASPGGYGNAILADFGIARVIIQAADEVRLTQSGFILGAPAYMAPEQFLEGERDSVDQRADIYSLGVTLYEMLTGRLPFAETQHKFTLDAPRVSDERPDVPPAVDAAIRKALGRFPVLRFDSIAHFVEALGTVPPDPSPRRTPAGRPPLPA